MTHRLCGPLNGPTLLKEHFQIKLRISVYEYTRTLVQDKLRMINLVIPLLAQAQAPLAAAV